MFGLMKLNLKSDLKFHRFAICFFFQIEAFTCTTSTTRYYKSRGEDYNYFLLLFEVLTEFMQNVSFKIVDLFF